MPDHKPATGYQYIRGWAPGEGEFWADLNGIFHLQAVQWEPAGQQILDELGDGSGLRAVDVGCGGLGWLRLLSRWVGETGEVVGTEVGESNAEPARQTVRGEGLSNVSVVVDDVFHSNLPDRSFDLVHARNILGPVGRPEEQLATYSRIVKPGGWLVLEDILDLDFWTFNPEGSAPASERLVRILAEHSVSTLGRKTSAGRQIRSYLRRFSEEPVIRTQILTLPPGHAYRALILVGVAGLRESMTARYGAEEIDDLLARSREELRNPEIWCTSYPLVQGYARMP
jgi:ubiquinone/menaquinone biosynthesis C-methylase UbiE